MEAGYRVFDALMKALSQAVPERVIAWGFDTTTVVCLSCPSGTGFKVNIEVFGGGFGAGATNDGCDAVDLPLSNCSNTPVEVIDGQCDYFRVIGYELQADSFGHGQFRGGAGFVRRYAVLADGVQLAMYSDRFRLRPQGLFGGTMAMSGRCTIHRDGARIDMPSKGSCALHRGDVVEVCLGGGGGYGPPGKRDPALVARDVKEGLLSPAVARAHYAPAPASSTPVPRPECVADAVAPALR
jgi:N-methylhydantoinase B